MVAYPMLRYGPGERWDEGIPGLATGWLARSLLIETYLSRFRYPPCP